MHVLLAEDSVVYRQILGNHLRDWGFHFTVAKDGSEAWALLQRQDCPKLILLDWVLPGIDGVELCRRVRHADSGSSYSYVILLTGKDAKNDLLEAMQAGADDYLTKPFDELELRARLLAGKRIVELHKELVSARESMRYAATHDSLTGVLNRGEVFNRLRCELERYRRSQKPVSIILADVDHFKSVNDTEGHPFGDEVLREIAGRFRSNLRVYDSLGRYGGEEFLVVLPDCDLVTALIRADELRSRVCGEPVIFSGLSRTITVSLGVAVSTEHPIGDVTALLSKADQGLYEAKRGGRNRAVHSEKSRATP